MAMKRKAPANFFAYAEQVSERLRAIADSPETPLKLRVEVEMWFFEMAYGKNAVDGGLTGRDIRALDLSQLTDEELTALADELDDEE